MGKILRMDNVAARPDAGGPAPSARLAGPLRSDEQRAMGHGAQRPAATSSWSSRLKQGFRVTGWFKRGELEELVRASTAKSEAIDPFSGPVASDVVVEPESLTAEDRSSLSLDPDAWPSLRILKRGGFPADPIDARVSSREVTRARPPSRRTLALLACMVAIGVGIAAWRGWPY